MCGACTTFVDASTVTELMDDQLEMVFCDGLFRISAAALPSLNSVGVFTVRLSTDAADAYSTTRDNIISLPTRFHFVQQIHTPAATVNLRILQFRRAAAHGIWRWGTSALLSPTHDMQLPKLYVNAIQDPNGCAILWKSLHTRGLLLLLFHECSIILRSFWDTLPIFVFYASALWTSAGKEHHTDIHIIICCRHLPGKFYVTLGLLFCNQKQDAPIDRIKLTYAPISGCRTAVKPECYRARWHLIADFRWYTQTRLSRMYYSIHLG